MGNTDRSQRDDNHRRHGNVRRGGRHRLPAVEVQLPGDDRAQPGGLRNRRPQLCPRLPHADRRTQLRPRRRALRFLDPSGPQPERLQRDDGVPPLPEDRHRGGRHLPARRLRRTGKQRELRQLDLPVGRGTDGTGRPATDAERLIRSVRLIRITSNRTIDEATTVPWPTTDWLARWAGSGPSATTPPGPPDSGRIRDTHPRHDSGLTTHSTSQLTRGYSWRTKRARSF